MVPSAESGLSRRLCGACGWLPLVILPVVVIVTGAAWTPWILMWALAFSIYIGLKWMTFADAAASGRVSWGRSLGYLLLWPGMDAPAFFCSRRNVPIPACSESVFATAKMLFGFFLVLVVMPLFNRYPYLAGWIGMAGIIFVLHFGSFHLLSVFWRYRGIDAAPLMDCPILALSLSDFWGRRWNLAFRDLSYTYVFRPFVGRLGPSGATMLVFLVSGIVHDAVISIPAHAGFGLPTIYFVIQGCGLLAERSRLGKRFGLRNGVIGRGFCVVVTIAPACLLFHRPFVYRVIIPMLTALEEF